MWQVRSAFEADYADTDCADDREDEIAGRPGGGNHHVFSLPVAVQVDGFTGTGFAQPMSGRFVNIAIGGNSSVPIGSMWTTGFNDTRPGEAVGSPRASADQAWAASWNDNESRSAVNLMTMRATSNSTERSTSTAPGRTDQQNDRTSPRQNARTDRVRPSHRPASETLCRRVLDVMHQFRPAASLRAGAAPQDRAWRRPHEPFGNAADHQMRESSAAVRAHHDQVDAALGRVFGDRPCAVAEEDLRLDGYSVFTQNGTMTKPFARVLEHRCSQGRRLGNVGLRRHPFKHERVVEDMQQLK